MSALTIVQPNGELKRSRAGVPVLRLHYTPSDHLKVYHRVELTDGHVLEVFGDGDNAAYEWVLIGPANEVVRHSDCGYGIEFVALRDGLIDFWGAPDKPTTSVQGRYYECGEGYAHPIGTVCTGQCVLRG